MIELLSFCALFGAFLPLVNPSLTTSRTEAFLRDLHERLPTARTNLQRFDRTIQQHESRLLEQHITRRALDQHRRGAGMGAASSWWRIWLVRHDRYRDVLRHDHSCVAGRDCAEEVLKL